MAGHSHSAEGAVDITVGTLLSIITAVGEYSWPMVAGMLGAIGSIIIRVIYKKYFKKYFEHDEGRNSKTGSASN